MPEVQKTVQTGEMTQRFIEFVMMHAQNAALFLGQIPNPKTGEAEINLDLARMFIDQLEMIQEKTRGNLTNEETMVLRNALSNLQMAFVEVSGGAQPEPARKAQGMGSIRSSPHFPRLFRQVRCHDDGTGDGVSHAHSSARRLDRCRRE